jgi:hypothetical protein
MSLNKFRAVFSYKVTLYSHPTDSLILILQNNVPRLAMNEVESKFNIDIQRAPNGVTSRMIPSDNCHGVACN